MIPGNRVGFPDIIENTFLIKDACITACPKDGANFWLYRIVCAITKNIRNLCIFLRYGKQCYVG